jgi:hypothetical protein
MSHRFGCAAQSASGLPFGSTPLCQSWTPYTMAWRSMISVDRGLALEMKLSISPASCMVCSLHHSPMRQASVWALHRSGRPPSNAKDPSLFAGWRASLQFPNLQTLCICSPLHSSLSCTSACSLPATLHILLFPSSALFHTSQA